MTKHYDYIAIGGGSVGLLQLTVRQAMAKNVQLLKQNTSVALV